MNTRLRSWLGIAVLTVGAAACGGGGGDGDDNDNAGSAKVTLSGTVATGSAFEGEMQIVDALGGLVTALINAAGQYSAQVDDNPPFMLQATGTPTGPNAGQTLYSIATSAGTTNVTQLTTLALNNIASTDLDTAFQNWMTASAGFTQQQIEQAVAQVNANFQSLYTNIASGLDPTTYDFFSQQFSVGDSFDQLLDDLMIDFTGSNIVITSNSLGTIDFDLNINIGDFNIGGGTGAGSTGACTLTLTTTFGAFPPTQSIQCIVGMNEGLCSQLNDFYSAGITQTVDGQTITTSGSAAFGDTCGAGTQITIDIGDFQNPLPG